MSIDHPTLLVVEDEPAIQILLLSLLEPHYQVLTASDGVEALERIAGLEADELDLILLDVMMPRMSGHECLEEIRKVPAGAMVPVIFLSALGENEEIKQGLKGGAVDYIIKPFDPELLLIKVSNHIQQKHHKDQLHQMSMVDPVTGLYNRRLFDERLKEEWNRCLRINAELTLLMIDIDHFKYYNDHYGHAEGDRCLALVAEGIHSVFQRSSDFVARYGGEEFVVVLPQTSLQDGLRLANRLLEQMSALAIPNAASRTSDRVTVSVGVAAMVPAPEFGAQDLVVAADSQLYQAKANGRNCVMPDGKISPIHWQPHFSVGHAEMDEHHQRLVGYLNEYASLHFQREEQLLSGINYPGLQEQALSHQRYLAKLGVLDTDEPYFILLHELVSMLRGWWEQHILVEDMAYKGLL